MTWSLYLNQNHGCLRVCFFLLSLFLLPHEGVGQQEVSESPNELKKLSLEELMAIEVTLVSRTPQKLSEAASSVQVLTGETIRRSGATSLPEALRLVTNLQVAQLNASTWIISSRGFNTIFANKLLVMIDGRSVYTPFFGGVLWELQNVLLEDVERIEIVSGPGGTLWGANAVNGIINIVTKSSAQTQNTYVEASVGTFLKDAVAARHGGKIGENLTYRIYGQHADRNPTQMADGTENTDAWRTTHGGFRADFTPSVADMYTIQGDWYGGVRKTVGNNSPFNGQNILGRWTHTISDQSDLTLQFYFDRYYRDDAPSNGSDEMKTYDFDFQHRFLPHKRHRVLWGVGYQLARDDAFYRSDAVGILPRFKTLPLYTGFLQDEIQVSDRIRLTLGTKLLHTVYSGFEIQPNARMAWTGDYSTLWSAVSRAVRTPTRLDVDYFLPAYPVPGDKPSVAGGPNFISEKLVAYELGYRIQPNAFSNLSLAGFYNVYRDIYSVEALPGTLTYQIQNGSEGESWGLELAGNVQLHQSWRVRGGYTYFMKDLRSKPGRNFDPSYLGNDVKNQVLIQSMLDLAKNWELDVIGRYLDHLPKTFATTSVPAYFTLDARLAFSIGPLELSLVGQNLWKKQHVEFGSMLIPRGGYFKVKGRF